MTDIGPNLRPLLVVEAPPGVEFKARGGGSDKTARPSRARQAERLAENFDELQRLLDGRAQPTVEAGVLPTDPELVIVFEVIQQTSDLSAAFGRVGLELLLDLEDEIEDDALGTDFARKRPRAAAAENIKRYLHAAMANEEAVRQLLTLWNRWKSGQRMAPGYGDFTTLFNRLFNLRRWGPDDRIRSTGLDAQLRDALAGSLSSVPLNIELWYRSNESSRQAAESTVRAAIEEAGGRVLRACDWPEIGYHALAAEMPPQALAPAAAPDPTDLAQVALLQTPDILYVRPGGQNVGVILPADLPDAADADPAAELGPPLLGVLDGLPEANHPWLKDRIVIIDPDDAAADATYTVERRRHGTMVASAVVWGDRGSNVVPAKRLVAVRPVMRPDLGTLNADEIIPWDATPADTTIRAVRDLVQTVPTVRIINVSLGDPQGAFDTVPSAWARAVDWLSATHNLLFVVSAGNQLQNLPIDATELRRLEPDVRDRVSADAIADQSSTRRLLAPAESLNALTVGALHSDGAGDDLNIGYLVDVWSRPGHPSPITAHGRGIRRSIKPDLAAPGGRQLYRELIGRPEIEVAQASATPPGIQVAAPPDKNAYAVGTTFAAAEVSRRAAEVADVLIQELNVGERFLAAATKALICHGALQPDAFDYVVEPDRVFGHGELTRDVAQGCSPEQATILFIGELRAGESAELLVPFPDEVARLTSIKRVTTTLAWLSPINWNHRQYRRAKLTVEGPREMPSHGKKTSLGVPYHLGQRGTLEHRVFDDSRAFAAQELTFAFRCAGQAGGLVDAVPYALAVSLEVGTDVGLDVYQLVSDRLAARVQVR